MEEKHFKILDFLSRQTAPVLHKDFPEEIQEDFRYRDTPLKEGSLYIDLQQTLTRSKKWVEAVDHNRFIITETGRNAMEREVKIRADKEHRESITFEKLNLEIADLRNKYFDYDKIKHQRNTAFIAAILGLICTIIAVIVAIAKYIQP